MTALLRAGLADGQAEWAGDPPFNFVGGHNDSASVPFGGFAEAAATALARHGPALAFYNLGGSPQGHLPLREFVAEALARRAHMSTDPSEVLVTSGSLQALDLVNAALLAPGDTVIVEKATYAGTLSRLAAVQADVHGVELDSDGIRIDHLNDVLESLSRQGRRPKFIYTIPTVQNPTGTVMPVQRRLQLLEAARRYGVAIFEDDCYADLVFDGERPPTIRSLDSGGGQVVYCGSFSKTLAPALRLGYIVADWPMMSRLLALKTDAGSGALEQITVAEYAAAHFDDHVDALTSVLSKKCDAICGALRGSFGDLARFEAPRGGIYVWVALPDGVDTDRLVAPAAARGVEFNPGSGWCTDPDYGSSRMRLCFGHLHPDDILAGIAALAEVVSASLS
ncbi:MAG: PLP-dependent aminotransferase family protein [Acidimicrobiaceae bacterium]|nr:PLP-dependent aminotransferase family protein [Acidimicrobiaceae bacterium]MYE09716.1 PLP-dependent aminotransferase family protein [Acidimicrobiaceae bacterium]MYI34971.1 PLP-dependent aminotransferase family protein [Acidimicrobiaceae bacterium]